MTILLSQFLLLAEEVTEKDAEGGGSMMSMLILFGPPLLLLFVMQTLFGRSDAKDKARRNEMTANLKKNDPIITIGGIMGTVVSVSEDKSTVTIRVDDNTRIKLQASAIREVVSTEKKEAEKS
ncbi:preprotein translocase subunit YajC [Thalassoglobus sp.]|uniref:preprotein translocase subunit YajC n=1 Tax=Thalassoglobus sp. TaxID=2795869 RepID=UPI003AA8FAF2